MRYYRLDRVEGGELPQGDRLKVGAIIRVPRSNSLKPGAQFNHETGDWAVPIWVECEDPTS